jgi:hypothetical protein
VITLSGREARGGREVAVQHEGVEPGTVAVPGSSSTRTGAQGVGIGKWLEHRPSQLSGEIDVARASVADANRSCWPDRQRTRSPRSVSARRGGLLEASQ